MEEDMPTTSPDNRGASEPPPPEWTIPAKRTDTVGLLAWQMVGPPGGVPDFTAAGRLVDALLDAGDHEGALRLRRSMVNLMSSVQRIGNNPRSLRRLLDEVREKTLDTAHHLLYDFDSVMNVLAHAATLSTNPPAAVMQEESANVVIVRADVGYHSRGSRIVLPDGRRGVAIAETDDAGITRVMIEAA